MTIGSDILMATMNSFSRRVVEKTINEDAVWLHNDVVLKSDAQMHTNSSKPSVCISSDVVATVEFCGVLDSVQFATASAYVFLSADDKFACLVSIWKHGRGHTSSATEMTMHPAYQRIIAMGDLATPLILRQLKSDGDNPDHWFSALMAITGENPVPAESRGNMLEMARAWLEWGNKEHNK